MEMILDKALCESDCPSPKNTYHRSKQACSLKRGNPAKDELERHNIDFPTRKRVGCSFTSGTHNEAVPSPILCTAPRNEGEEAEQLAMVMRESIRYHDSKDTFTLNQSSASSFQCSPRFPVFSSAVNLDPIRHHPITSTISTYNPTCHSADFTNFPTAYPPSLGNFPAYQANVGPFHYLQTENGVWPMSYVHGSFGAYCMESTEASQAQQEQMTCEGNEENRAIVESAEQRQNTEVTTNEAVSLLMNMRADHNQN